MVSVSTVDKVSMEQMSAMRPYAPMQSMIAVPTQRTALGVSMTPIMKVLQELCQHAHGMNLAYPLLTPIPTTLILQTQCTRSSRTVLPLQVARRMGNLHMHRRRCQEEESLRMILSRSPHRTEKSRPREESFHDDRTLLPSQRKSTERKSQSGGRSISLWF